MVPDGIKITSDGFYKLIANEHDDLKCTLLEGPQNIWALREPCEIEEGVTLNDIFCIVARNEELKTFLKHYSKCRLINDYHERALDPPEDTSGLKYLEIGWECRLWKVDEDNPDLELWTDVCGRGPKESEDMPDVADEAGDIRYGIDLTPVNKLAGLPIVLNQEVYINVMDGDKTEALPARREFTLLDVLDALYWEISFFGSEEDKVDAKERLSETADEIAKQMEDGIAQPINPDAKEGENKIYLSDQVRDFLGKPSNLDERIKESSEEQDDV
tara:strand:+ start:8791 stop:9609 length:819 start_codon:yes stop_codon:yes gene_type:complete